MARSQLCSLDVSDAGVSDLGVSDLDTSDLGVSDMVRMECLFYPHSVRFIPPSSSGRHAGVARIPTAAPACLSLRAKATPSASNGSVMRHSA